MLEHPWLKEAEPPTLSEAEVRQAFDDIGVGGSLTLDETYMEGIRSLASGLAKRARELMTSGVFETGSRMGSLCSDATGGGSRSGSFRMQSFGPRKKGARLGSAPMAADNSASWRRPAQLVAPLRRQRLAPPWWRVAHKSRRRSRCWCQGQNVQCVYRRWSRGRGVSGRARVDGKHGRGGVARVEGGVGGGEEVEPGED